MPKGIYDRSGKGKVAMVEPATSPIVKEVGINKVQVSQMPDRQSANANVESIRQTHGDEGISTTERLFGTPEEQDQVNKENPVISQEPLVSVPLPQNPEQANEERFQEAPKPVESIPQEEEFIDWDKMSGKKIRQKVDGKEVIVTAEELKKYSDQDQIKKHLAEAADRVGDERRKLAEERRQIQELRQQRQQQYEAPLNQQSSVQLPIAQPQVQNPVLQRIQFLETQLQQLAQGTQPVIYQNNRQRVSDELKGQGFSDFLDYIPKMEAQMTTISDPQLMSFYDTPQGAKALYFQLKAQDMVKIPAREVPRRTESISNPIPPAIQVDGGTQLSGSFNDDSGHNLKAAFKRAVALGDDREAWNEVLRQKGVLPD